MVSDEETCLMSPRAAARLQHVSAVLPSDDEDHPAQEGRGLRAGRGTVVAGGVVAFIGVAVVAAAFVFRAHGPLTASANSAVELVTIGERVEGVVLNAEGVPSDCDGCRPEHSLMMRPPVTRYRLAHGNGHCNVSDNCFSEHGHPLKLMSNGAMKVNWYGKEETKYLAGAQITDDGHGMTLTANPFMKVYLMHKPVMTSSSLADFALLQLAGHRVKVDVDMGNPGASCGCNVAFFLVSMPGQFGGQWGDYYCDANCVGGNCCAEFDLMEMNTRTMQVTSHPCTDYRRPPFQSRSSACDHGGHPEIKFGNGRHDFGAGGGYTIDSQKKFTFTMEFPTEDGKLKGYVTLTQNGLTVRQTMHDLNAVRKPLTDGMVLVLDAWQSRDMTWLDGGVCHAPEQCNLQSTKFSNFEIVKLGGEPAPGPQPQPGGVCQQQSSCGCGWATHWCGPDDGSKCWCDCCCERNGGTCNWRP